MKCKHYILWMRISWKKSGKPIYFDFKEKGKNILTLTVIIDVSSKCQVLFQIKKIKYKF